MSAVNCAGRLWGSPRVRVSLTGPRFANARVLQGFSKKDGPWAHERRRRELSHELRHGIVGPLSRQAVGLAHHASMQPSRPEGPGSKTPI